MSLIGSLLALLVIPLKTRPPQEETKRERELADEVRRANFALDYWRDAYARLEAEYEQLLEQRDVLRGQLEMFNRLERVSLRQSQSAQELAQVAQQAQAILAQQYQQAQLAAYNHGLQAQAQGLQNFGPQNAVQSVWHDCTCVPSRAQVLGIGE